MTARLRTLRRAFLTVLALRWLAVGLSIAVSVLVMTSRGLSLAEVGVAIAAQGIVVAVLELPTGGLADAIGRRPVLVLSGLLFTASTAVFLVADSLLLFLASYALTGVARALDSGPLEAWFVDELIALDADEHLERELARAGVILSAAVALGSLLVAAIGVAVARGWLLGVDPITAPVAVAVAVHAAHAAAAFLLVREHRPPEGAGAVRRAMRGIPAMIRATTRLVAHHRGLRAIVGVELLWGVGITAVEVLWQPRTAALLGSPRDDVAVFGLLSAGAWVVSAAGAALAPVVVRALRDRTDLAAAVIKLSQGLAIAGMALAGGVWVLAAMYLATYVMNGASSPLHMSLLHRRGHGSARATLLSVHSLFGQAGGFSGTLLLPALAGAAGVPAAWLVSALVFGVSAPLYFLGREAPSAPAAAEPALEQVG